MENGRLVFTKNDSLIGSQGEVLSIGLESVNEGFFEIVVKEQKGKILRKG